MIALVSHDADETGSRMVYTAGVMLFLDVRAVFMRRSQADEWVS